jgi:hypothetical protein
MGYGSIDFYNDSACQDILDGVLYRFSMMSVEHCNVCRNIRRLTGVLEAVA